MRVQTPKISQKAGDEPWFNFFVDTSVQSPPGSHRLQRGGPAFCRLMHFSVFVCASRKKNSLFAQELYLHSQALFGRGKLIPGPFLGRVHQLSHSPQTLCTQRGCSPGPLLRCPPPQ